MSIQCIEEDDICGTLAGNSGFCRGAGGDGGGLGMVGDFEIKIASSEYWTGGEDLLFCKLDGESGERDDVSSTTLISCTYSSSVTFILRPQSLFLLIQSESDTSRAG